MLKAILEKLTRTVECALYRTQENEFGRKLEDFVNEMFRLSPEKIRISRNRNGADLPASPCFTIGNQERKTIAYAALPAGHQLAPFLKALEWIGTEPSPAFSPEHSSISAPAELQVLISEQCPHCPKVVESAILLASRHPLISSCIIDAGQYPDIGRKYGIKSVPATIVDRRLVLNGSVTAERMMELLNIRGTAEFEREAVVSLIENGKIPEAAECLAQEAGRDVILALAQDVDFSKRLSALVVMEKALDNNPDTVRAMAPAFAALLSNNDARIRGDIADLLGKIGDLQTVAQLERLISDPDPDVAEIAAEAIAELRKRFG